MTVARGLGVGRLRGGCLRLHVLVGVGRRDRRCIARMLWLGLRRLELGVLLGVSLLRRGPSRQRLARPLLRVAWRGALPWNLPRYLARYLARNLAQHLTMHVALGRSPLRRTTVQRSRRAIRPCHRKFPLTLCLIPRNACPGTTCSG